MKAILTTTSMIAIIAATPSLAQTARQGAPHSIEDIIVTAQKRPESRQKAPLAVTVISSKELDSAHVTGATDLQRVIPNLAAQAGGGAGDPGGSDTLFTIRGLGASASGPQGSSGVAAHFDGVYRQDGISNSEFFDLDRIEVDPGPQGTLYGRSAAAGAVNIISAKPNLSKNEYAGSVDYGNYNALTTQGMVNRSWAGKYALRLAFQTQNRDGFYSNGYDDLLSFSGRGQFLAKPTDKLSIRLMGSFSNVRGVGTGNVFVNGPSYPNLVAVVPQAANPDLRDASISDLCLTQGVLSKCRQHVDVKKTSALAEINYDFGPAVLTLLPAYNNTDRKTLNANAPLPLSYYNQVPYNNEQFNFEGRLSSPASSRLKWVVGANYYDNSVSTFVDQYINVIVPVVPLPSPPFPPGAGVRGVASSHAFESLEAKQTSTAAFGQATYPVTDWMRLTLGGRYNWDSSSETITLGNISNFVYANTGFGPVAPGSVLVNLLPFPVTTPVQSGSQSFTAFTYRAAIDIDVGPRSLVYASIGSGYKPGGLNDGGPKSATPTTDPNYALAPDQFFGPEKVTHFELGSKNRFFDNTLQVNAAAYYDDYKNYQNGQTQVVNPLQYGTLGFVVTNAGKARIFGAELDSKWRPTPNDAFGIAANYLNAKFTSYVAPAYLAPNGPAPAGVFNDFTLPNAPEFSANLSYQHTFDLRGSGQLVASVFSHLSQGYWVYFAHLPGTYQRAYSDTTLDLTWTSDNGHYSASAFVSNVEDRTVKVFGGTTGGYVQVGLAAPRVYGGRLAVKF